MAISVSSICTLLPFSKPHNSVPPFSSKTKKRCRIIISSVTEDREAASVVSKDKKVLEEGSPSPSKGITITEVATDTDILTGRAINAAIILGFGAFAVTKLLTIDHDYWHVSFFYFISKFCFFFYFSV